MAHQPHNIPWSSLTSNLRWAPASRKTHHIADYHPQGKPNQGDDFTHFVKKFVQCLKEQSEQERKKYPEAYQRPDDDEDIIGDAITAKIFPTIRKWRKHAPGGCNFDCAKQFCSKSSGEPPCCPILPLHERKMSAFCREYQDSNCYLFYEEQSPGYFNMEVVKTLILYGDMEPLLRACSHPDVAMEDWRTVDECGCCVCDYTLTPLETSLLVFEIDIRDCD